MTPSGAVTASDNYNIINNSPSSMTNFVLDIPINAENIAVKDESGTLLPFSTFPTSENDWMANVTLTTALSSGQATNIIASYSLASATIQGSQYTLSDFKLFPNIYYYVDEATFTFNPPEGATITIPQVSSLDSSSSLTRNSYQDTLTVTRDGISFIDYALPARQHCAISLQLQSSLGFL